MNGYIDAGYNEALKAPLVEDSEGNLFTVIQHSLMLSILCSYAGKYSTSLGISPLHFIKRRRLDEVYSCAKLYLLGQKAAELMKGPGASKIPNMVQILICNLFPETKSNEHIERFKCLDQNNLPKEMAGYISRYVYGSWRSLVNKIVSESSLKMHLGRFLINTDIELTKISHFFLLDNQQNAREAIAILRKKNEEVAYKQ